MQKQSKARLLFDVSSKESEIKLDKKNKRKMNYWNIYRNKNRKLLPKNDVPDKRLKSTKEHGKLI